MTDWRRVGWRVLHSRALRWGVMAFSLLLILGFGFLLLGGGGWLVRQALNRVQQRLWTEYRTRLHVGEVELDGLRRVRMRALSLVPQGRDTLAHIAEVDVQIRLLPLLTGDLQPAVVQLQGARMYLRLCNDSTRNLLSRTPATGNRSASAPDTIPNFAASIHRPWLRIRRLLPEAFQLRDCQLDLRTETGAHSVVVPQLRLDDGSLRGDVHLLPQQYAVTGSTDGTPQFTVTRTDSLPGVLAPLPLLERWKLALGARQVQCTVRHWESGSQRASAALQLHFQAAALAHPRLSQSVVALDSAELDLRLDCTPTVVVLDSNSRLRLNGVDLRLAAAFDVRPDTSTSLRIDMPWTAAQAVFNALPPALFESVQGMRVAGQLRYQLQAAYRTSLPDSVQFNSSLTGQGFQIQAYGPVRLTKLREAFRHRTYRDGRVLLLGDSNPDFTKLADISNYLREAVMTSEDGSFRWHNGFNEAAIRQSIVDNLRQGRFARGGSTISMQLVKNVFLTPEKTLGRKLEEALLVWLIESQRLVSKDRMYEVYLNLIEWGPNVYGAAEASRYYFGKHPSQIYVDEAVFLAMIVPRPRAFMYCFNPDGTLREAYYGYYRLLGRLLRSKGVITPEQDSLLVPPNLQLAPPALARVRERFRGRDTLQLDSIDSVPLLPGDGPDEGLNLPPVGLRNDPPDVPGGQR